MILERGVLAPFKMTNGVSFSLSIVTPNIAVHLLELPVVVHPMVRSPRPSNVAPLAKSKSMSVSSIDNIAGTMLSSLDAFIHKGNITIFVSHIMTSVLCHASNTSPDNSKLQEMTVGPTTKSRHGHSPGSWVQAFELRRQQIQSNNPITLMQVTVHLQNDSNGVINILGLPTWMQRSKINKLMPRCCIAKSAHSSHHTRPLLAPLLKALGGQLMFPCNRLETCYINIQLFQYSQLQLPSVCPELHFKNNLRKNFLKS
jgi:hypothetical protein